MNVTHNHTVYQAREISNGVVYLDAPKQPPLFICSLCGAEGPSAEKITHRPDCPEAKKTAAA